MRRRRSSSCPARSRASRGSWARTAPDRFVTLSELVHSMLAGPVARSRARLQRDLKDPGAAWEWLHNQIAERTVDPALVHGDVCPPNAYVSAGPAGPVVTGIGDFSPHTVNGDPMMDIAGAVVSSSSGSTRQRPTMRPGSKGWPSNGTERRPRTGSRSTGGSTGSTSPTRSSSTRAPTAGAYVSWTASGWVRLRSEPASARPTA